MKILSTLSFFCIAFFLSSCLDLSAPKLTIPAINEINRITVYKEDTLLLVIEDPTKIADILDFLKNHNNGWEYPLGDTMPIYPYRVLFTNNGEIKLVIWIGDGGLGGRNEGDTVGNRVKSLSPKETEKLLIKMKIEKSRT